MCAATAVFYCNKIYSGKNLFLPAKTIFASPVFSMEKKRFFPPSGKNLPTLITGSKLQRCLYVFVNIVVFSLKRKVDSQIFTGNAFHAMQTAATVYLFTCEFTCTQ